MVAKSAWLFKLLHTATSNILMVRIARAYVVTAYILMVCIARACIVMAYKNDGRRFLNLLD